MVVTGNYWQNHGADSPRAAVSWEGGVSDKGGGGEGEDAGLLAGAKGGAEQTGHWNWSRARRG